MASASRVGSMPSPPDAKRRKSEGSSPLSGSPPAATAITSPADLPPPTFDLDTWTGNYDGPLLPYRLAHLAFRCAALRHQALCLAIADAKNGKDVQLYVRLCDAAGNMGFADLGARDEQWLSRQEEANKRELARLESELRGYKNNLIRESIRMGQEDLATHHLLTGGPPPDPTNPASLAVSGLGAAYAAFGKMREHATTPAHIASMTLRLILTSLLQAVQAQQLSFSNANYLNAASQNAHRLRSCGVKEEEQAKLTTIGLVTYGIAQMGLGRYKQAAEALKTTPFTYATLEPALGGQVNVARQVASANDVAVYGGLCALATMSRQELQSQILSGGFRAFLELEPHVRKAISLYTTAKYQACLSTLQRYYSDWSLDVFLGAPAASSFASGVLETHVDRLFARIREKSITAYFSSFSRVSLTSLAMTFPPLVTSRSPIDATTRIETEVLQMIESGTLQARLDVVNGLLEAPERQARSEGHGNARAVADEVERGLMLRLNKVNVGVAALEITRPKGQGTGWGEGTGAMATAGNGGGGFY